METILAGILIVGFVGSVTFGAFVMDRSMQLQRVSVAPVQINDDEAAKTAFLELLEEAKHVMVIYDDGNEMENSIYMDNSVLEAVGRKLEEYPEFRIRCLFNCEDPSLLFRKFFSGHDRVDIMTVSPHMEDFAVHYKIIDDGKKAYLSKHSLGNQSRIFRTVSCEDVPARYFEYVAGVILGKYSSHFETSVALCA